MTATNEQTSEEIMATEIGDEFIVAYFVDMTPDLAGQYMRSNTHNRNLRPGHVKIIAADMSSGRFKFNGAPILFADDGTLIDGQHRLAAVVMSGETVPMLVLRGFHKETQNTVDTGARRVFGDVLGMRGEKQANDLAALTRLAKSWSDGNRSRLNMQASTPELLDFLADNPDLRDAINPVRPAYVMYGASKSHMALAWWLFNRISAQDNEGFWQLLIKPQQPPHPIAALQSALLNELRYKSRGHRRVPLHQLAIFIKTWNAYISGEEMNRVGFKVGGARPDHFPEPISPLD